MPQLYLHNKPIGSIFELLGEDENDITYSVGWALNRSPSFLRQFLVEAIGYRGEAGESLVRLQDYRRTGGITDIEIELSRQFHVIIEAKKGWNLPGAAQLEKYAPRLIDSAYPIRKILVLSECRVEYAHHHLECQSLQGIPVEAISWKAVARMAEGAAAKGGHVERQLLRELLSYLGRVTTMQNVESNWVFVVSLGRGTPKGWSISLIDIVGKQHQYFHRVGTKGWPKDPPNYIAFRYAGKLQSIHHIEGYEVFTNPHDHFPDIPKDDWEPHYLYTLGAPFAPVQEVRTGNIYPSGRVWCMLDTLFTCKTISEARDLSQKRGERQDR